MPFLYFTHSAGRRMLVLFKRAGFDLVARPKSVRNPFNRSKLGLLLSPKQALDRVFAEFGTSEG
jgi:hypothetical protein